MFGLIGLIGLKFSSVLMLQLLIWFGSFNEVYGLKEYQNSLRATAVRYSTSRRRTFYCSQIPYWNDHTASFKLERLLLIGNVNPNPGLETASKTSTKITPTSLNLSLHKTQLQEHAIVTRS